MKQKIYRFPNDSVSHKHYVNDMDELHGLQISYWFSGNISSKYNWFNYKPFGLSTNYYTDSKIIEEQIYYL